MGKIIYFSDHLNSFKKIEPLINEVCTAAGITHPMSEKVIDEYRLYFKQLTSMSDTHTVDEQLNHACHIILGLLIKAQLPS